MFKPTEVSDANQERLEAPAIDDVRDIEKTADDLFAKLDETIEARNDLPEIAPSVTLTLDEIGSELPIKEAEVTVGCYKGKTTEALQLANSAEVSSLANHAAAAFAAAEVASLLKNFSVELEPIAKQLSLTFNPDKLPVDLTLVIRLK